MARRGWLAAALLAAVSACGSDPPADSTPDGGVSADGGTSTGTTDGGPPGTTPPPPACSHPDCPVATLARDDVGRLRATSLVVHGGRVFYHHTGNTEPGIYSVSTNGGERKKLAALTEVTINEGIKTLAADATHVYFLNRGTAVTLERVPVDGGTPEVLATGADRACFAVDADAYYWFEPSANGAQRRGLWRRAKAGGDATRLADEDVGMCAEYGANVYWSTQTELRTVPKAGGTASKVHSYGSPSLYSVGRIIAGPDGVHAGFSVYPYDGSEPKTISPAGVPGYPIGAVLDGATMYWMQKAAAQSSQGPILRADPDAPAQRLTYSVQAHDVAVDDAYVYWGDYIGAIRRVAKK